MGNNNSNLQTAKNIKDDEFYTTYEAIEKELQHYLKHFRGKVVLCNCDDPFKSNFCRYFVRNFNKLGLKRLICTSYVASEGSLTQTSLFDCNQIFTAETHGRVLDLKKFLVKLSFLPMMILRIFCERQKAFGCYAVMEILEALSALNI